MSRTLLALALLPGCMSLDPFYFNPTKVDAYSFPTDVVPLEAIEQVTFESEDGVELWGAWLRQNVDGQLVPGAPGYSVDYVPTIATFHGNSEHMALGENWRRAEVLWSAGFDVFTFDYRGFGRSGGEPTHDGIILDGLAAKEHIVETVQAERGDQFVWQRIPVHGLSLGGGVALQVGAQDPPMNIITEDTYANPDTLLETGTGGLTLPAGWFFEDPFDNAAAIAEVDAPVLIMHGAADAFIPRENAEVLYAAANDPKDKWIVPGSDHARIVETDRAGFIERIQAASAAGLERYVEIRDSAQQ
jgi:fermentation-respiration switch protein FrsA (DUF1100 family)